MPRLYGVRERYARIVVVPVGGVIPCLGKDAYRDLTSYVFGMSLLPAPDYKPPGTGSRPLGPTVGIDVEGRKGMSLLAAPATIHMDRYFAKHYSTIESSEAFGAAVREMVAALKSPDGLKMVDRDGEPLAAEKFLFHALHGPDALEYRPVVIPVRATAKVVADAPFDGLAVLEMLYTRDVA